MAETEFSQENIAAIRTRLDNLEKMTRLSIASNPRSAEHIEELFRQRAGSADIYLVLEMGPKSQAELAQISGKSQSTVSRILTYLHESGLIDKIPESGRVLWMWHDMERALGISRVARRIANNQSAQNAGTDQQDA